MISAANFAPFEDIALALLPHGIGTVGDASHDAAHLLRVWRNVEAIRADEGGDGAVLAAATVLHDCVDVSKDAPNRASASRMAAEKAGVILHDLGWAPETVGHITHAIEAHSFSANIPPETMEARILQDADRLDAIGHIGIARCFYVSGMLGRGIYDPDDPSATHRELDDLSFALDHFQTKLLRLSNGFLTASGRALAAERHHVLQSFMEGLLEEVTPPKPPLASTP